MLSILKEIVSSNIINNTNTLIEYNFEYCNPKLLTSEFYEPGAFDFDGKKFSYFGWFQYKIQKHRCRIFTEEMILKLIDFDEANDYCPLGSLSDGYDKWISKRIK
jgi:hypothetical protein